MGGGGSGGRNEGLRKGVLWGLRFAMQGLGVSGSGAACGVDDCLGMVRGRNSGVQGSECTLRGLDFMFGIY